MILNKRFATKSVATLLQASMEVVSPLNFKQGRIVPGVHEWEAKLAVTKSRYSEEAPASMKLAVLVGMPPRDYQDMILQTTCAKDGGEVSYEEMKDHILVVTSQKMTMINPIPMDLDEVDVNERKEEEEEEGYSEEEMDVSALINVKSYLDQRFGHLARNCPVKEKGKGKDGGGKGGKGYGKN